MATSPSQPSAAYQGFQRPKDSGSDLNALTFLVTQLLGKAWTGTLFLVKAVTNTGGVSAVGYVDVQPLVHQVDGDGNATPHGIIHNVPYFRLQGGTNAVILDPQVGDIGAGLICSRDISAVKVSKGPNVPGSGRRFDPADAIYLGGVLNGTPTQYVQFSAGGVAVVSPTKVTIQAPEVDVNATTKAVVTTPECDLISDNVNLGGTGGKKVVLDGDPVIGGGGGTVQASSTKVKAV